MKFHSLSNCFGVFVRTYAPFKQYHLSLDRHFSFEVSFKLRRGDRHAYGIEESYPFKISELQQKRLLVS